MNHNANRVLNKFVSLINRLLNRSKCTQKVFCIGLHKTGTSSLHELAKQYGYKATHSTDWDQNEEKVSQFEFFSDGGSHFDEQNELHFEELFYRYPEALFVLQTRDVKKWVVSKLIHAGWDENTNLECNDPAKIYHYDWTYKSLLTVESFIKHRFNYEKKVINFFKKEDPSRLLVVDIINMESQLPNLKRVIEFLGLKSIVKIKFPHKNKAKNEVKLSTQLLSFIDQNIEKYETT